jgi:hypothetical protein
LLITGYIFSNYSLLAYKEISTMKFDLYSTRKKTSLGTQMVEKVNRLIAGQINGLFDDSPSCKFLEIGPGVGLFADILHSIMRDKLKYHAIEPNASLCERGIQKGYAMENAQIPPFPDLKKWGSFDCIYFSHVLEHMPGYTAVAEALNGVDTWSFFHPTILTGRMIFSMAIILTAISPLSADLENCYLMQALSSSRPAGIAPATHFPQHSSSILYT